MAASRNFYSVRYVRLPELFAELAIARGDGTYRKVIKQYKQVKLLILDEWLLFSLKENEARDLLEIVEARHKRASTMFCSQFDVAGWHLKIGEPTLADAICVFFASLKSPLLQNKFPRHRVGIFIPQIS